MEPWAVPLSDVDVSDELAEAVRETVESGWWSMGPRVAELEREFASLCGTAHALAVANGTVALHAALVACGCGPGDEVVLPSLNFVAAANVVVHTGATPVFCDIVGEEDLNLDPRDLEVALSPSTKAVIALHYGGYSCAMDEVLALAADRGFSVVEDAAHAPGATLDGRACGSMGAIGCFSFFSNKNLPVGEGGMLVTNDDELSERLRLLRSHGMTTMTWDRHRGHAHSYDVVTHGFNYRLDEIRAAMALVQLGRLAEGNAARARIVERYRELLDGVEGISMPFGRQPAGASSSHHLAVALLPPDVPRGEVREALAARRIQTSVHYPPIHSFTAFREVSRRPLPRTDALAERILTLPLFPHLTDEQVELVAEELVSAVRASSPRARAAG
jgi:dTDP-4-amino-4,6-dideoxygalactose transaminase